jgi:hypothetical protein
MIERLDRDSGQHDDRAIALALAAWKLTDRPHAKAGRRHVEAYATRIA